MRERDLVRYNRMKMDKESLAIDLLLELGVQERLEIYHGDHSGASHQLVCLLHTGQLALAFGD